MYFLFTNMRQIAVTISCLLLLQGHAIAKPVVVSDKPTPAQQQTTPLESDVEGQSIQHFQRLIEHRQFASAEVIMNKLRLDPLDAYARFLWLKAQPNQRPIAELIDYIQRYPLGGWTNQLKQLWAEQLAKDKEWSVLSQHAWLFDKDDARCWVLQAQAKSSTDALSDDWLEETASRWLNTLASSEGCALNDTLLLNRRVLSAEQWQSKIQLLLAQSKSAAIQPLIKWMPESTAKDTQQLILALNDPQSAIDKLLKAPPSANGARIFMNLMRQLTLKQADQAVPLWQEGKAQLGLHPLIVDRFERTLYLAMSKKDPSNATDWLRKIAIQQHDEMSLLPLINEALLTSNWQALNDYLSWLPNSIANDDRWLYWRAKAFANIGQTEASTALFQTLATHRSFYGFMAADLLSQPYQLNGEQVSTELINRVEQQPLLQTIRALYTAGLKDVAWKEWRYYQQTGQVSLQDTPAYAYHALSWGWTAFSVLSLGNPQHWNYINLRFPMPYQSLLQDKSQTHNIPLAWSYGIMRRESAYAPNAKSTSGAMGLMQLMPKTAKALEPIKNMTDVYEPSLNVHLGTKLLGQLKREFGDQLVYATASYNAGGFRVRQWIKKNPDLPIDQWIELIPYKETRDYVKAVMEYMLVFERLGDLSNTRITQHLQNIQPTKVVDVSCNPETQWCL